MKKSVIKNKLIFTQDLLIDLQQRQIKTLKQKNFDLNLQKCSIPDEPATDEPATDEPSNQEPSNQEPTDEEYYLKITDSQHNIFQKNIVDKYIKRLENSWKIKSVNYEYSNKNGTFYCHVKNSKDGSCRLIILDLCCNVLYNDKELTDVYWDKYNFVPIIGETVSIPNYRYNNEIIQNLHGKFKIMGVNIVIIEMVVSVGEDGNFIIFNARSINDDKIRFFNQKLDLSFDIFNDKELKSLFHDGKEYVKQQANKLIKKYEQ